MAVTGKTGADAIFKEQKRICIVLNRYNARLVAVIAAAQLAGAITSGEAATLTTLVATANQTCNALEKLAGYSGF